MPKNNLCYHSNSTMTSNSSKITSRNFEIPVPFGHISAKEWGPSDGVPVLAIHGWQDNAGTFDNLIPLLLPNLRIVAIDLLGHGLSSHKPPGCFYHFVDRLVEVKRVADYLNWQNFSLLGHSLGGTISILFASVYPDMIDKVIALDIIKPASRRPEGVPVSTKAGINQFLQLEKKQKEKAPVYSMEEAIKRLTVGLHSEVTDESAKVLLKRGTRMLEDNSGYIFTRDIRIQSPELLIPTHDAMRAYVSNIKCDMLIVKSRNSNVYITNSPEEIDSFKSIYKKYCRSFKYVEVDGNHFVHLNNPERVAYPVNSFFETYQQNKL